MTVSGHFAESILEGQNPPNVISGKHTHCYPALKLASLYSQSTSLSLQGLKHVECIVCFLSFKMFANIHENVICGIKSVYVTFYQRMIV